MCSLIAGRSPRQSGHVYVAGLVLCAGRTAYQRASRKSVMDSQSDLSIKVDTSAHVQEQVDQGWTAGRDVRSRGCGGWFGGECRGTVVVCAEAGVQGLQGAP